MSGFEVAGIVLGVIPIVISALESYNEGLSAIQRWRKYEREVRSLIRNLETERLRLQTVCEKLLMGIASPSRIEEMIDEPMGPLWGENDVRRKIQSRLWKSAKNYEEILVEMRKAINEMATRIAPNPGSSVLDFKRVAFTLKRSRYVELLGVIERGNSTLENLTDRNIELEPKRRVRSQGKLLDLLRDISRSLYKALTLSMRCTCTHDVSLRLESRSADINPWDNDEHIIKDIAFQLALSYNKDNSDAEDGAQLWEEMLVRALPMAKIHARARSLLPSQLPKPKMKGKSVSFTSEDTLRVSASSSVTTLTKTVVGSGTSADLTMSIASITLTATEPYNEIKSSLCERLHNAQKQAQVDCYGTIASPDTRKFAVYPAPFLGRVENKVGNTWAVFSLQEALDQRNQAKLPYFSYRDRLHLAVIISSSILQLHNTPWLSEALSCRDIFFLAQSEYPVYEHPFVMRKLSDHNQDPVPVSGHQPLSFMRNATLLSLGILLIELILGRTLDSLRTAAEESAATLSPAFADYMTAQRLLPDVQRASSNYASAVLRCIDGDFHRRSAGLDDEDLRHEVYSGVVALLDKDWENA